MFRFEAEPGESETENHKIVPTVRLLKEISRDDLVKHVRHFLSRNDIRLFKAKKPCL